MPPEQAHDSARLPVDGGEWLRRAEACDAMLPGLGAHLSGAPLGWFPLLEAAAGKTKEILPEGTRVTTHQVKEKFGTLRWYVSVTNAQGDQTDTEFELAKFIDEAQELSATRCAVFGTPDGERCTNQGWIMTLSPAAQKLRQDDPAVFRERLYPSWTNWPHPAVKLHEDRVPGAASPAPAYRFAIAPKSLR